MISYKDKKTILSILFSNLGSYEKASDQNYKFHCPFCNHHKKKLEVHVENQKWNCWVCSTSGLKIHNLLKKVGTDYTSIKKVNEIYQDVSISYKKHQEEKPKIFLPKEFVQLYDKQDSKNPIYKQALYYLKGRGIDERLLRKYNIGISDGGEYDGMIIIPSYDGDGDLNYFISRTTASEGMKYKNPPVSKNIVMFENQINWNLPIVLCEGVLDAISIRRNAIPLLGTIIQPILKETIFRKGVEHIIFSFDDEPKAIESSMKYATYFSDNGIKITHLKLNDKDPNDIGFKGMVSLMKSTKETYWNDMLLSRLELI